MAARELLLEYGHFVLNQPSVASFCFGSLQQEADALPDSYLAKQGGALLATRGHLPIGFVAWRTLPAEPDAWELKRLWTRPEARGLGLGRTLVQAVIDRARAAGKFSVVLDTEPGAMSAACDLYLKMGFAPCPSYSGMSIPGIVYMQKFL